MTLSTDTWKLIDDGMEEARDRNRVRWEKKNIIHAFTRRVRESDLRDERPTDEQLRERVAGQWLNAVITHSRRNKPPLRCTLPGVRVWLPEELVLIDGWYVPRGELLPDEQRYLASGAIDGLNIAKQQAEYEEALAIAFEDWADQKEREGRQRIALKEGTFLIECGHIVRIPVAAE